MYRNVKPDGNKIESFVIFLPDKTFLDYVKKQIYSPFQLYKPTNKEFRTYSWSVVSYNTDFQSYKSYVVNAIFR
jgi:hypothetical protein